MLLTHLIEQTDRFAPNFIHNIRQSIESARAKLNACPKCQCCPEPIAYRKFNGQLAVELETEVFEKFEKGKAVQIKLRPKSRHLHKGKKQRSQLYRTADSQHTGSGNRRLKESLHD